MKLLVTGLYICDNKVIEFAKAQKPSVRGERKIVGISDIKCFKKNEYYNYIRRLVG